MSSNRLRIAMQKSGRLSQDSQDLLKSCGLKINKREDRLIAHVENMPIDILRVRDDDIPGLVMDGVVDLGIVGENVLEETRLERVALGLRTEFKTLRRLDYGDCRLSLAIPTEEVWHGEVSLNGSKIATTYPNLLKQYLNKFEIEYKPVLLTGSVEVAPRAGLADAICDLVSSGATIEANGLKEVQVVFRSKAVLIQRSKELYPEKQAVLDQLLPRLDGMLKARGSKYIMLHAPASCPYRQDGCSACSCQGIPLLGDHGENQAAGCKFHSGTADREDARLTADSSPAGAQNANAGSLCRSTG